MTAREAAERHDEPGALLGATDLKSLVLRGGGVSAGILAITVMLRVMAVSGWNWHTASTVAETIEIGDVATIGLGTIFEQPLLTGVVLMVAIPLGLIRAIRLYRESPPRAIPLALALVGELVIAIALIGSRGQWWLPIGVVVFVVALATADTVARRDTWRPRIRLTARLFAVAAVTASFILAATVPTPWVPRERITEDDGTVVAGYVLEAQPGFLKVLIREDHELIILPIDQIVSRDLSEH